MNTLEKAKLTASFHLIERLSKSGIPNYNCKVTDIAGRKKTAATTKTQPTGKRASLDVKGYAP